MKEIICDKCGKKYKVDETKIKGDSARLKCKGCDNVLTVTKDAPPAVKTPEPDATVSSGSGVFTAGGASLVTVKTLSQPLHLSRAESPFILVSSTLYFFPHLSQMISFMAYAP